MPNYITFFSYTRKSAKAMMERPSDRTAAARALVESVGGQMEAFYRSDLMNPNAVVLGSRFAIGGMVVCVSLLLALSACKEVRPDDAAQLVGSWTLVSYEDRGADGTAVYPYGKAPSGLLVYDATGHMAVQMMKTPPPDVASDDWDRFTTQEKVALFDGYVAYFGRFEVDPTRKVVTHLPSADLSRLYIGKREERHYQLTADRLVLSETWLQSGKQWSGVRVFDRLK